jgi:hypothetical protein
MRPLFLALALGAAACCFGEELILSRNVILRSNHGLASLKAGTVVELVSRDEKAITVRYNGQTGTIPPGSAVEQAPAPAVAEVPTVTAPVPAPVTPAIILGPLTLFLANSPADSPDDLREYIPDDESLEHWLHMASTRVLGNRNDPQAYLTREEAEAARTNPRAHHRFLPGDGQVLELMTYAPASYFLKFAQWSLTKAKYVEGKGLVVSRYAVRYFNYGDATEAKVDAERDTMLQPFESSPFEELTNILKPHDVRLRIATDAKAESNFPNGSFFYWPKVSLDFTGYMPDGIEVPAYTTPDGRVVCLAAGAILLDANGSAMPFGPVNGEAFYDIPKPVKGKGEFRIHTDDINPHRSFELPTGGRYTLVVDCYLTDPQGKKFIVSASQDVTIGDTRAPDRSVDPAYRP